MSDAKYADTMANAINQALIGGTITQAVVSPVDDCGDSHFGFMVHTQSGKNLTVWVLSDPEGNGAGFLDIQEG